MVFLEYNPGIDSNVTTIDFEEKDLKKSKYYYELAAKGGEIWQGKLGLFQLFEGNNTLAYKHFIIAAVDGNDLR